MMGYILGFVSAGIFVLTFAWNNSPVPSKYWECTSHQIIKTLKEDGTVLSEEKGFCQVWTRINNQ